MHGVFDHLDPQPGAVGHGHPAALLLDGLGHQLVLQRAGEGLELKDDVVGRAGGQVQRRRGVDGTAPGMGIEVQMRRGGHVDHLLDARNALYPARVRQVDVGHAQVNQPPVAGRGPLALAGRHLGLDGLAQMPIRLQVGRRKRVLDPAQVGLLKLARHPHAAGMVPACLLAQVHHEIRAVADGLAHGAHVGEVALGINAQVGLAGFAETHLNRRVAVGDVPGQLLGQVVQAGLGRVRAGAGAQPVVELATQQLVDGHAQRFALEVPQGNVQRADGKVGHAGVAVPPTVVLQQPVERVVVGRVAAEQHRRKPLLDEHLDRQRGLRPLRDALAPPHQAGVGLHFHQGDVAQVMRVVGFGVAQRIGGDLLDLHTGPGCLSGRVR